MIGKYKMAKHFDLVITANSFTYTRNTAKIGEEAALDGLYVVRSSVAKKQMDSEKVVETYKSLAKVERAFRCMKTVDLSLRPIYHRDEDRIRSHVFICMLAYYVEWHMREKLRSVLFAEDDHASAAAARTSMVAAAQRSESAQHKDSTRRTRRRLSGAKLSRHPDRPWHALSQPDSHRRVQFRIRQADACHPRINSTSSISWESRLNPPVPETAHSKSTLSHHLTL